MYWAVRDDGKYEIIDGQQRTISVCQYIEGDFSMKVGNIQEVSEFSVATPAKPFRNIIHGRYTSSGNLVLECKITTFDKI